MAVDHALATCLGPGEGVLRLYRWASPTASFGRNEPARGRYDLEAAQRAGIEFVRRPTGGRAVLHDRELTYAVALPVTSGMSLRAVYRMVNEGLVKALGALGVPATMASAEGRALSPAAGPCFRRPSEGEVTVEGRKLVGSAQARIGSAILQHGSLLLGPGQERLADLRGEVEEASDPTCLEASLVGLFVPFLYGVRYQPACETACCADSEPQPGIAGDGSYPRTFGGPESRARQRSLLSLA